MNAGDVGPLTLCNKTLEKNHTKALTQRVQNKEKTHTRKKEKKEWKNITGIKVC